MNREFDRTKFKVLAGILSESNLYEQGEDPFIDYSNRHHSYAEKDFEDRENSKQAEQMSYLEIDLSHQSQSTKDTVIDTLQNSSYYRDTLGVTFDDKYPHSVFLGKDDPIPADEAQDEINQLFRLLKSNTGEEINIAQIFREDF